MGSKIGPEDESLLHGDCKGTSSAFLGPFSRLPNGRSSKALCMRHGEHGSVQCTKGQNTYCFMILCPEPMLSVGH